MNKLFAIVWVSLMLAAVSYVLGMIGQQDGSIGAISFLAFIGSLIYGTYMVTIAMMLKKVRKNEAILKELNLQFAIGTGLMMLTYAFYQLGQHHFLPIGFSVSFAVITYASICLFPLRNTIEILRTIKDKQNPPQTLTIA